MNLAITEDIGIDWALNEVFMKLPSSKALSFMDNHNDVVHDY
jgi:hypothetical protein